MFQLFLRFPTVKFQLTVCATEAPQFREISHGALLQLVSTSPYHAVKDLTIKDLTSPSRRRLNTGSALTSRQEATPASAEVGPSTSSTPSVSLRGDTESAKVSSSLSGKTIMDTHGSVVPSQSSLVEPRINNRRDRSPSETSDEHFQRKPLF